MIKGLTTFIAMSLVAGKMLAAVPPSDTPASYAGTASESDLEISVAATMWDRCSPSFEMTRRGDQSGLTEKFYPR